MAALGPKTSQARPTPGATRLAVNGNPARATVRLVVVVAGMIDVVVGSGARHPNSGFGDAAGAVAWTVDIARIAHLGFWAASRPAS
jgi:hypothetical protein